MQQQWQQLQKHLTPARIKLVLCWVLLIAVLLQLAKLTWFIVDLFIEPSPPIQKATSAISSGVSKSPQSQFDAKKIADLHIFGEPAKAPVVTNEPTKEPEIDVTEAQKTRLNLKLMGVYASDDPEKGVAVVEHNNDQNSYKVGDNLPGGRNIILRQVVPPNKIIFENNGNMESLEMENFALDLADKPTTSRASGLTPVKTPSSSGRQRTIDKRRDREITKTLQEMRGQLATQGINSFKDLVSVSMVQNPDGSAGLKIRPGKDRRMFARFGFQMNDVVKNINGLDLSPTNMADIMNLVNTGEDLSLVVQRGNTEVLLQFSLTEANQPSNSLRKKEAF